jgi:hypothetical protein
VTYVILAAVSKAHPTHNNRMQHNTRLKKEENQFTSYRISALWKGSLPVTAARPLNDNEEVTLGEKPDHGDRGEKVMNHTS